MWGPMLRRCDGVMMKGVRSERVKCSIKQFGHEKAAIVGVILTFFWPSGGG